MHRLALDAEAGHGAQGFRAPQGRDVRGSEPGMARMGSTLTKGLDGQITIAPAPPLATSSIMRGCGRAVAMPAKRKPRTGGTQRSRTK